MIALFVILAFVVYLTFFFPLEPKKPEVEEKSPKYKAQMKKLWQISQTSMKERKPFRAEKALLTILKFDEKNAAAYNRLGILYAKAQKEGRIMDYYADANSHEYFAQGCDAFASHYKPHKLLLRDNPLGHTIYELMDKDPELYKFIKKVLKK